MCWPLAVLNTDASAQRAGAGWAKGDEAGEGQASAGSCLGARLQVAPHDAVALVRVGHIHRAVHAHNEPRRGAPVHALQVRLQPLHTATDSVTDSAVVTHAGIGHICAATHAALPVQGCRLWPSGRA